MIAAAKNTILDAKFVHRQVNFSQARKSDLFRNNANDLARGAVDHDLLAQDVSCAAEAALPKGVCDEDHFSAARQIVSLGKIAARFWRQAENAKKVPSDARGADSFRICFADPGRNSGAIVPKQRQLAKALLQRAPIKI